MASVIIDIDIDNDILGSIQELREMRRSVLAQQLRNIPETLEKLTAQGALLEAEKNEYEANIRTHLSEKLKMLATRMEKPSVVYGDELEFYYELIQNGSR
jgi:flagellar biosynthesis chaperone FliJ